MIVRAIDENNDWTRGKGKSDYKKDRAAIAQNIKTRLQSFLGDCFFAVNEGIDWWNLLGSKNSRDIRLALATCILDTEGVNGLAEIEYETTEQREFKIRYVVTTVYGTVSANEVFREITI
ncbi:hypothetical protein phi1422_0064 [Bdellovibrio phage phi1422]|uniref:baseplate wedge subunit n=1 Tax=Bdellovibrio phage phi1422 TaxID=1127515 RepID=UPI0002536D74|nr:baseplate wedge subunit [Bdellovibrio phage phi1422]AFC22584.1 hypothetical protein phi1422_0064 [Bdellovibrio phage phi1422]